MRWRRLIPCLLLAGVTTGAVLVWPTRSAYLIPGDDDREFLTADPATRQLLFVYFDQQAGKPPVIERRAIETGHIVSATPLDWADVSAEIHRLIDSGGQDFGARFEISADASSLYWSETVLFEKNGENHFEYRSAVFDTKTGRHCGPVFTIARADCAAWSPDGRWLLAPSRGSAHHLGIIDTRSGRPLVEFDPPPGEGSIVRGCFSPDSRHVLFQWSGPIVYQVNLASRSIERTHRLAEFKTNEDNDDVWETLAEWRPGELRTRFTYVAAGITQFFESSSRYRTCRHRFDGQTLEPGAIDPLLDGKTLERSPGTRGEGDGWVAQAIPGDSSESKLSQWLGAVESWLGRGLLMNWKGRFGGRDTVRIIDRATNAVRYEQTEMGMDTLRVVLDGNYLLRMSSNRSRGIEVWRTDAWPRWWWAVAGGAGMLVGTMWFQFRRGRSTKRGAAKLPPNADHAANARIARSD